ncbi:MAG: septal ring lytic transglycosylase RlpA family protein [Candidatus Omnitrophica bacterium]|nr:septal ring lytic transglycosylase RlpA family protein [Candidatus Omnitrophota bacterium]
MKKNICLMLMTLMFIFGPSTLGGFSFDRGRSVNGTASWYSQTDRGIKRTTANMEVFDDHQLTCAMWNVPFGTLLKVTNCENGKSIMVRVNDRGPARRLVKRGRIIDLTKKAFAEIADLKKGLIKVKIVVHSFN